MVAQQYDAYGPIYIHADDAEAAPSAAPQTSRAESGTPENARMLRSFMRRARVATYWASSAMIVSSPFALYMDFDLSKSPPGWAVASFVVGSLGFYLLLVLIPARILGRVILFVLGDGTSRIDVWLRLGFVILIPAIIAGAITVSVMERRDPSPALTIVTVTPTTIPTASVTSPPAP